METYTGCIIGAVVQLHPARKAAARQRLRDFAGVDIHAEDPQSRLVITIEGQSSKQVLQCSEAILNVDGVLSVTPVYQHCEEDTHEDTQGGWKWR